MMKALYKIAASKYYDVPDEQVQARRLIANAMDKNLPNAAGNEYSFRRIINGDKYSEIADNVASREGFYNEKGQLVFKNPKHAKMYQTLINHPDVAYSNRAYIEDMFSKKWGRMLGSDNGRAKAAVRDYSVDLLPKVTRDYKHVGEYAHNELNKHIQEQNLENATKEVYTPKEGSEYLKKERRLKKVVKARDRAEVVMGRDGFIPELQDIRRPISNAKKAMDFLHYYKV